MKKLFALLLVLVLLVPMCLVAQADSVAAKPFYGLGWTDFDNEKFSYMEGCATLSIGNIGDVLHISYGGAKITAGSIDDEQVTKMANALKKTMDARPEGMRYLHFFGPGKALGLAPENVVYLDHGVNQLKEMTSALFKKYYEIGGKVEGAIMAVLYTDMGSYYINTTNVPKDPMVYKKIVSDPRYATEVRPMLEERGFVFYDNVTDYTPEIYGISGKAGSKYSNCRAIWDTVMRIRLNAYVTEWCYEPMAQYFPDVYVSDYQSADTDSWHKAVSNDGGVMGSGGNSIRAGNTSCENFYSGRPTSEFYKESGTPVYKNIPTYNEAVYEDSRYNAFRYDMNVAKRVYTASGDGKVCYWVSRFDGGKGDETAITNSPYYSEQVYHLNLLDPKPFVVFLNKEGMTQAQIDMCTQVPNELLAELTRVAGYADRKPIEVPMTWNSEFVLSGMYANGRNIWRITPNIDEVSKADFKVEGSDPTFRVAGQTVTFPGGKIIEDTAISQIGTCGYWVETAKDVTPIITNDADRFVSRPAYSENFDSYAADSKLTSMVVRDQGGWIIQPKGNDLLITADKALSITGNSLLQNKLIPANLTLGDEYAVDQSWEVTITVPEGMNADAQITFLNYEANNTEADDGGFQILGGKLYYAENGEYKEMTDLTPGKYVFRRDLHFAGNFTCTYTVTDADGNVVKKVEDVAIPTFTGKVTSIGITCKNMNVRLLVDDYSLRVAGAAADLYLYEAAFGMQVETDALQTQSTVYRMSWANATAKEETASVMASFYEGDTLKETKKLQELTLKPGHDGVEIGTVEVPAGQKVKIYLTSSLQPDAPGGTDQPTTPTTPGETTPTETAGNTQKTDGGNNTMLIVIIAVAVVAVAGVVLALVLTKKKQKNG